VIGLAHTQAGYEETIVDEKCCNALRAVAGQARVTVSMFVFTCFCTFLHLSSGAMRFAVTITQANRTHPDLENVFGFIASGQRICMAYTEDPTLGTVCEQTRNEFAEAALRHETDTRRRPRDGVGFESNRLEMPAVPGLSIDRFRMLRRQRAEFGLKLKVDDRREAGIELGLEYCVDCFSVRHGGRAPRPEEDTTASDRESPPARVSAQGLHGWTDRSGVTERAC